MTKGKKIISLLAAAAMTVGMFSVVVNAEETNKSVNILFAAQKDGEFIDVPHWITVPDGIAEEYGYDMIAKEISSPTFADALVAAAREKYGDEFTKETAKQYLDISDSGFLTTAYQNPASSTGYYINSSSAAVSTEAILNDGDTAEFFFYQDTAGWSDKYTYFDTKEKTAKAGEDFELILTMSGYDAYWQPVEVPIDGTSKSNDITINTVNKDGSISEPLDAAVGEDGKVSLRFDEAGSYIVTAQGFVNETNPIVAPICMVTVSPFSFNQDGTAEIKLKGISNAELILARYDDNGRFVSASTSELVFSEGTATADKKAENGDVITIWNSVKEMKPITKMEKVNF